MIAWWMIILALPVGTALLFCMDEPTRIFARRFAPWVSVPPVAMAIFWPAEQFADASWFMFGGAFGLDASGQFLMLLTSVAWAIASFYARRYTADDPKKDRFWLFFLLTMAGNLGLIGAFTIGSFYLFFALMTFSAFGLVVHDETTTAHFAARVYITMAILGEALLLV
ncbi:MAG: NADH-ubiquinone oxidoreductase, partial [Phycisphaerales bacterium]